jgi:hypothetical protein
VFCSQHKKDEVKKSSLWLYCCRTEQITHRNQQNCSFHKSTDSIVNSNHFVCYCEWLHHSWSTRPSTKNLCGGSFSVNLFIMIMIESKENSLHFFSASKGPLIITLVKSICKFTGLCMYIMHLFCRRKSWWNIVPSCVKYHKRIFFIVKLYLDFYAFLFYGRMPTTANESCIRIYS